MFRGATARTVISLLAAALLTLQFFAPSASFASVHTARHVEAKTEPRNKPRVEALRDEHVTCGDDGRSEHPSSPLRIRDRHRLVHAGPELPERPPLAAGPRRSARTGNARHASPSSTQIADRAHPGHAPGVPLLTADPPHPPRSVMHIRRAIEARQEESPHHAAPHRQRPYVRTAP